RGFQRSFSDPDGVVGRVPDKMYRRTGGDATVSLGAGQPDILAARFSLMIHADLAALEQPAHREHRHKVSGAPRRAGQRPVAILGLVKARYALQPTSHL